jgi:outer membrane immunogenic protein
MKMTGKLLLAAASVVALSGGAMAADLDIPTHVAPAISAPAATNWDGPYIGATVGYSWFNEDGFADVGGFTLGGQIGYNFHLADQIVAGIQGDIDWVNISNGNNSSLWDGAITARLGYDIDGILPYVEAGVAFVGATNGNNDTETGYTVGAGVEFMLADQLSANVEYRYVNVNNLNDNQFRVGLNYHF